MDVVTLGKSGLHGWRAKVGDTVADPVARHSRIRRDQVQAVVGAVFFLLSLKYVIGTVRRLAQRA